MDTSFEIKEIAIVIVAKNNNPTILNPDFLKNNGIVDSEWELANPPICVAPMAEVSFRNGIKITAQLEKLIFLEDAGGKSNNDFKTPAIALKYIETLPHVEYEAVGINPRGHVILNENDEEAPRRYILENLLSPGPWFEFGDKTVKATIKYEYSFKEIICNLTIEERYLQIKKNKSKPVIVFASNFHHKLKGESREERLQNLDEIIKNWESDLDTYKHLVNDVFLKGK